LAVAKSLSWLLEADLGGKLAVFTIAVWVRAKLSRRAISALRRALRRAKANVDVRFEFAVLIPATAAVRDRVFPRLFGKQRRGPTPRELSGQIAALAKLVTAAAVVDDECPLGGLGRDW